MQVGMRGAVRVGLLVFGLIWIVGILLAVIVKRCGGWSRMRMLSARVVTVFTRGGSSSTGSTSTGYMDQARRGIYSI